MESKSASIKKWFSKNNVLNVIFFAAMALLIFCTPVRVTLLRGLMKVGLFSPGISASRATPAELNDVIFQDSAGKQVNLASLNGKVVFINFWATWCPPCIAEMPSINELHTNLKSNRNIVFLMVDADGDFSKSLPFMDKHGFDLPVYIASSRVPQTMLGNTIPTTVVIDKGGKIAFRHDGLADYSGNRFEKFLTELAAK